LKNCSTRENNKLDLFNANVKGPYNSSALPPLVKSDNNLVLLISNYTHSLFSTAATCDQTDFENNELRKLKMGGASSPQTAMHSVSHMKIMSKPRLTV